MKNKKGFTLVELLAVIVILSLLALLTSTAITKLVKDSKKDLYDSQVGLIKAAAEAWGADNIYKLPEAGSCKYLTVENLKQYGLLDSKITNPKNNEEISDDLKIKITATKGPQGNVLTKYEVDPESVDGCTRAIDFVCVVTTATTKTVGKVPTGEFLPGDEYICNIGGIYRFFVLSKDEESVNLILNSPINNNGGITNPVAVPYLSSTDGSTAENGPITLFKFLSNAISSWTNIPKIGFSYKYNTPSYYGFSSSKPGNLSLKDSSGNVTAMFDGLRARVPFEREMTVNGCSGTEGSCPTWLTVNTNVNGLYGYWTIPSNPSDVLIITSYGNLTSCNPYGGITSTTVIGIRPVITLPKASLSDELIGDINGDEKIDVNDLTAIRNIISGNSEGYILWKADLNNDGNINGMDANYLEKILNMTS